MLGLDEQTWKVLAAVFAAIAVVYAIASGSLTLRHLHQKKSHERDRIRQRNQRRWDRLKKSGVLRLAQRTVLRALLIEQAIARVPLTLSRTISGSPYLFALPVSFLAGSSISLIGNYILNVNPDYLSWLFIAMMLVGAIVLFLHLRAKTRDTWYYRLLAILAALSMVSLVALSTVISVMMIQETLWANVIFVCFGAVLLLFTASMIRLLLNLARRSANPTFAIGPVPVAISLGMITTMIAMTIGHLAQPADHIPQSIQMLLLNVLCDVWTLLFTFLMLTKVARGEIPLLLAIAFDLAVSAFLACGSLWLSLAGTDNALTPGQTLRILVFLDHDGPGVNLGPYFWVMHTTFLPTFAFMMILLSALMAKGIVWLVGGPWWGKASKEDAPDKLMAQVMGGWLVIFGALATFAGAMAALAS